MPLIIDGFSVDYKQFNNGIYLNDSVFTEEREEKD